MTAMQTLIHCHICVITGKQAEENTRVLERERAALMALREQVKPLSNQTVAAQLLLWL